jgi:hypothetical protein
MPAKLSARFVFGIAGFCSSRCLCAGPGRESTAACSTKCRAADYDRGVSGPVFAYDWVTRSGELRPDGGSLRMKFKDGWDYQILSRVNRQGLSLLGDTEKIVPLGRQRIAAIEDHGALTVTIKFPRGEDMLTISGYAPHRPKPKALQGKLNDTSYDPRTKIFRAQIAPAGSGEAILQVSPL